MEFCPVVLFAKSIVVRYTQTFNTRAPTLGPYIDDIFGGFKQNDKYEKAVHFREFLCSKGSALIIQFNPKVEKTPMPAEVQVVLGRQYNSNTKRVNTAEKKVKKYRLRIAAMLATELTSKKEVERLHGNLNYVAEVEPFGRPFLAHLTSAITGIDDHELMKLDSLSKFSLRI